MYLSLLKGALVESLRTVFDSTYPDPKVQGCRVSLEYPLDKQAYPGVWVTYDDKDPVQIVSIAHEEFLPNGSPTVVNYSGITRWTYSGEATLTFVALSSWERDILFDQFVRIYAFSREEQDPTDLRTVLETNDLLVINVNWDELRPGPETALPGTPWGTEDEVIYERSVSFEVWGEFLSDPNRSTLVPLSEIDITGTDSSDYTDSDPLQLSI